MEVLITAKKYLNKAKELYPDDLATQFNWALLEQQYALLLTEQPLEKRSLTEMKSAIPRVEATAKYFLFFDNNIRIFSDLAKELPKKSLPFSLSNANGRAEFVSVVIRILNKKIHETETLDRIKNERLEEMKIAREKSEAEKKELVVRFFLI